MSVIARKSVCVCEREREIERESEEYSFFCVSLSSTEISLLCNLSSTYFFYNTELCLYIDDQKLVEYVFKTIILKPRTLEKVLKKVTRTCLCCFSLT